MLTMGIVALLLCGIGLANIALADTPQADYNHDYYIYPNGTISNIPPCHVPGYVDPITQKARELKSQGMSDDQIVKEMAKSYIWYDPKTGDWTRGSPELDKLQYPEIPLSRHPCINITKSTQITAQDQLYEDYCGIWTNNYRYSGFSYDMTAGSMATGDVYGTWTHYVTTHIGASGYCTEIGIARFYYDSPYNFFTYDDHAGEFMFVRDSNGNVMTTTGTASNHYSIQTMNYWDGIGYPYYIYLNGQEVKRGHLITTNNQISQTKEIFKNTSYSGSHYNVDATPSVFTNQYVDWIDHGSYFHHAWCGDVYTQTYSQNSNPRVLSVNYYIPPGSTTYRDVLQVINPN